MKLRNFVRSLWTFFPVRQFVSNFPYRVPTRWIAPVQTLSELFLSTKKVNIQHEEVDVVVSGWIRAHRHNKTALFLTIADGSSLYTLQVVAPPGMQANWNENEKNAHKAYSNVQAPALVLGTSVCIEGTLKQMPKGAMTNHGKSVKHSGSLQWQSHELHAKRITVLGACDAGYPINKAFMPLESLREVVHFRMRTNTLAAAARIRSKLQLAISLFFDSNQFVRVDTPIITPLDCEGAGEAFNVLAVGDTIPSSLNRKEGSQLMPDLSNQTNDELLSPAPSYFFSQPVYLSVSGQLYAELAASALTRVYTFGPTFRAETGVSARHLAEFWMVEPEVAFAHLNDVMTLAEMFVKHCFAFVLEQCSDEMSFFDMRVEKGLIAKLEAAINTDFVRITYTEAIHILQTSKQSFEFPIDWGCNLQSEHERYLGETHFQKPVFITNYPAQVKPFYMRADISTDVSRQTVACFDLIMPGVGELIGGSEREERYANLKIAMQKQQLDMDSYGWYLDLRKYGTVPHSGFGLGFERLLRYITGLQNLRDLIAVPRAAGLSKI